MIRHIVQPLYAPMHGRAIGDHSREAVKDVV